MNQAKENGTIIFTTSLKGPLFREARRNEETLSDYLRRLLATHPERATKKRGRPPTKRRVAA